MIGSSIQSQVHSPRDRSNAATEPPTARINMHMHRPRWQNLGARSRSEEKGRRNLRVRCLFTNCMKAAVASASREGQAERANKEKLKREPSGVTEDGRQGRGAPCWHGCCGFAACCGLSRLVGRRRVEEILIAGGLVELDGEEMKSKGDASASAAEARVEWSACSHLLRVIKEEGERQSSGVAWHGGAADGIRSRVVLTSTCAVL